MDTHDWGTLTAYASGQTIASTVFASPTLAFVIILITLAIVRAVFDSKGFDTRNLDTAISICLIAVILCFVIDSALSIDAYKTALRSIIAKG